LEKRARDLIELDELASDDPDLQRQVDEEHRAVSAELRSRELDLLFTDPYANHNAVITLSVGQGGVEAQDWVESWMRIRKWAESSLRVRDPETRPAKKLVRKSATFIIRGARAMVFFARSMACTGWSASRLRLEPQAPHLVRAGRGLPELEAPTRLGRDQHADLRIDTHRSTGAGGQHVTKTDLPSVSPSAHRHVVTRQNEAADEEPRWR
jgi:peptide chain release factor 2